MRFEFAWMCDAISKYEKFLLMLFAKWHRPHAALDALEFAWMCDELFKYPMFLRSLFATWHRSQAQLEAPG